MAAPQTGVGLTPPQEQTLERLELGYLVQEAAALPKRPRFRKDAKAARRARWLLAFAERHETRPVLAETARVVGLRWVTGTLRPLGVRASLDVLRERLRSRPVPLQPVAGYVEAAREEQSVVRVSMLLRLLGRRAEATRLLSARLRSPLPSPRSRRLLTAWLLETGEAKMRDALGVEPEGPTRPLQRAHPQLRYGVVVLTMFDSEIFRASIRSLLASDFEGVVVVVEDGNEPVEACRRFCEELGVEYIKNPAWSGCVAGMNLGTESLADRTDIVLFSHNDVLWPPHWLDGLDRIWSTELERGRIGLLNLGYIQFRPRFDRHLYALFLEGRYDDLVWLLAAMREIPALMELVQDVQVKTGEQPFGLARDPWVDSTPALRQMTGRLSVAASFPTRLWRELGGFHPDLVYAFDLQLLHENVRRRRWGLFLAGPPLVHLKSSDTEAIGLEKMAEIGSTFMDQTYDGFERTYGWQIEHYLNLWFSESTVVHRDAIVAAVNTGRFGDVDFVFDDFARRLEDRRLENCELAWCRTRATCPYRGAEG